MSDIRTPDVAAPSEMSVHDERSALMSLLHRLQELLVFGIAAVYSAGHAAVGLALLLVPVAAEGIVSRRLPWRRGPLDAYLLTFTLVLVVSGLLSPYRSVATGSAVLAGLTIYLAFGAPYRILIRDGRDGRFLRTLLWIWYGGGVGAALMAIYLFSVNGGPQAMVPALGPNGLGSTLAITLVVGIGLMLSVSSAVRYAVAAGAVVTAVALALTLSRGAWIGAAIGLIMLLVLARPRRSAQADPAEAGSRRVWPLLVLAAGVIVTLALVGGEVAVLRKKVLSIPNLFKNRERVYLARSALAIAADRPVLGSGLNTFVLIHPHPSVAAEAPAQKPRTRTQSFAHNVFLNMAAESGVLGLASFAALLIRGAAGGWRWYRGAAGRDRITSAAVVSAFVALLVHQQFDGTILSVHLSVGLWLLLAIMMASEPPPRSARGTPGP